MIERALRLIRVFHDLSQKELAEKLGISNSYLSEIEKGVKHPSLEMLQKYSEIFAIPASSILLFSENIGKPRSKIAKTISEKALRMLEFINDRAEASKEGRLRD